MNCKKCGLELDEGVERCPECGYDNASASEEICDMISEEETLTQEVGEESTEQEELLEETPKKKMSPGKIALLVVLAVVAVAVIAALVYGGMTPAENDVLDDTSASVATDPTIPADGNPDDVTCKGSYTVEDDELLAAKDVVVARFGEEELTNGELQVWYWMQFYNFINTYYNYGYLGMNPSQGLDTQLSIDGVTTWQQFLLDSALAGWQNYRMMRTEAENSGYELPISESEALEQMIQELETAAVDAGFASADEMLQMDMGVAVTTEEYVSYMEDTYWGFYYFEDLVSNLEFDAEEIEAYFDENAETFAESGIEKTDDDYVNVRHILVKIEGGVTDEEGNITYSDDEWETCRAEAQAILDQWLEDPTEENFAALASSLTEDPGSVASGGLYENVYEGQMVKPFEEWCFDEARVYGDYGLVQTTYGYHIMFFVERNPIWYVHAETELLNSKSAEILDELLAKNEMTVDYSAIVLGNVKMG